MSRRGGSRGRGRKLREQGAVRQGAVMTERALLPCVTLVVAAGTVPLPAPRSLAAQDTTRGKEVYVKWCVGCHGDGGAGDAAAATHMLPPPRNFKHGPYT